MCVKEINGHQVATEGTSSISGDEANMIVWSNAGHMSVILSSTAHVISINYTLQHTWYPLFSCMYVTHDWTYRLECYSKYNLQAQSDHINKMTHQDAYAFMETLKDCAILM